MQSRQKPKSYCHCVSCPETHYYSISIHLNITKHFKSPFLLLPLSFILICFKKFNSDSEAAPHRNLFFINSDTDHKRKPAPVAGGLLCFNKRPCQLSHVTHTAWLCICENLHAGTNTYISDVRLNLRSAWSLMLNVIRITISREADSWFAAEK